MSTGSATCFDWLVPHFYKCNCLQIGGNNHERTFQSANLGAMTAARQPPLKDPRQTPTRTTPHALAVSETGFTLRPAPDREPPFDDELGSPATEIPGPLQLTLPFPPIHPPVRHRPGFIQHSARRSAAGDPGSVARRLLVGFIEVAAQRRPIAQLEKMLSISVAQALKKDLSQARGQGHWLRNASIVSVRSTEPTDGVAELSATLRTPSRAHAAALRLEIHRGQWVCTRVVLG